MRVFFYHCYHCGGLHYSLKRIKKKKCLICERSFTFKNAKKVSVNLRRKNQAIGILQYLKKRKIQEKHFNLRQEIKQLAMGKIDKVKKKRKIEFRSFA